MQSFSIPHGGKVEFVDLDPSAEPDALISSLSELNSTLVLASFQPLSRSLLSTVRVLVELVGNASEEVAFLASRALTYIFDICPQSTAAAVEEGIVRALSGSLLSIADMDIAEQSLNCLCLLAREMPRAVLEGGGIKACVEFYDFFSQELQGLALRSVSCMCAAIDRESHVSYALEALPILCAMLDNKDSIATVRGASLCFERLCSSLSSPLQSNRVSSWQVSFLEKLANSGVVEYWIGALQNVGKREGVRTGSPLPPDVFGYKSRQQTVDGQKARSPSLTGGTLAGILCSLAKLVATAPTVLYLVYKLDVAYVIGTLLESFISEQYLKVDGVAETQPNASALASSCGQQGWSTGTISCTTPDFQDISAEERLLQAMILAVALLPHPGEHTNKSIKTAVAEASGMNKGEEGRDESEKKSPSVMFKEEEEMVVSSMKAKIPSVLELGVQFPWHDSNGRHSTVQWNCSICMFSNHAYALRCNICGTVKSSLVPVSVLPPPSIASKANSRDTTSSLQTSSSSSTPLDHEKLNQAEAFFLPSSVPCDDSTVVLSQITRYDVYNSSPVYLKAYMAHVLPHMLRLVRFCSNETVLVLILSTLESLFDLGYLPSDNLLWDISGAIGQFLSSPNMDKNTVRAVSLARKFLEAHDFYENSDEKFSSRHDWWWGENDFGKWSLHHRFGVVNSTRKTHENSNNKPISGRADDSYRVMYVRHGIVHHVTRLLKSLCSSFERLGHHEQCTVLQTNLKCIILETEVLAFMLVFASGDKWILTTLNLFPQQSKSKAASLPTEQQTPLISHRRPHIKNHNNQQQLEDAPPAMSLVSILLDGWRSKVIPASSLDEMKKKTIALLAAAAAGDDNDAVGANTTAVEVQESIVLRKLLAVAELLKKGPQSSLKNVIVSEENDHHEHKGGIGSILTFSQGCCTTTQSPSYQSMNLPGGDIRCCSSEEKEEDPNLVALITILECEEDVTVHEMRESKILEALLDYFFVTAKYPLPSMQYMGGFFKTFSNGSSSSLGRLRILFNKIQECLAATETGSFCRNVVHHNGKTDAVRYNGLLHPFFVRVVSSKTLLEAADDCGGGQETLKTSGEDSNSTPSSIVLIEPLTTVKEACAFIGNQISSLTTTRKLAANRKDMDATKGLSIDLKRAHHLKGGYNPLVSTMHTNYSHMSIGKGGQCSTVSDNENNRKNRKILRLTTTAGLSVIQQPTSQIQPPSEVLCSVSEAEAFFQGNTTMKRFRGGGVISEPSSACLPGSTATLATAQNLKKKGKRRRHDSCGAAAASSPPPKPGSLVYIYLINGEDKLPVCRKCTVLAIRDDGTCDLKDVQCNKKGGITREAVPLTHIATSPILLPFRKQRHYASFQREVMNDRLVLPEHQIECTRQKSNVLNRSHKGGYCIPMLRRMMFGMVCEGQRVITRQKVQVLYPQGLQLQKQCLSQQSNAHAQEGKRVMSSGATSSTSSTTVLPSTGIGRTRNECQSGTNIYSDTASSASIVPEGGAIEWRMKCVSKSGEEYIIDLSSLPPSTTIFEVVQKLLYMCKRGERGGGEEISATNNYNHKSIVVGPEEWERTYYIDFNLKVLNHDHQNQQLVKPKSKPKEDKDWIAPDALHSSLTSFDATLHHVIRSFRGNKDFWAPAGNLATVLHLLAVLQALLDKKQWRFCASSSPMTLISPLLGQTRSLSSKLLRQCCDPLSLCTETLPEWCRILPSSLPSLLTLESRMNLFFRTAFGSSHSLDAIQDMSRVVEEEIGGKAANSTTFEDGGSSCSSFASLEFDSGGSDSTMLTNHNLTLFQRLGHLGRLKRLRVVVNRNNILPVSCTLFSALVDGERDEKEQHTFVRIKGIGWKNECGTIRGFPVMLKVDGADESLDNEEEEGMGNENEHVGVKNGTVTTTAAAAAHSLICQYGEDMKNLHAMDCDTGHFAPPPSGGGVFNHGLDSILSVEFEGETGHGTGPTQEFYTLICQEMRKSGLGLWHHDNDKEKCTFLNPPEGLYPKPHPPGSKELNSAISLFLLLGRVIGKSLKDGHRLDLPLSLPLCKILVGGEGVMTLDDVKGMDVMTGQCLKHVLKIFNRLSTPERTTGDEEAKMLCLTWSLPGCAWYALRPKEKGCDEDVKSEDLGQWVNDVITHLLLKSVEPQLRALVQGITDIFNITKFRIFLASELQDLLCGAGGKQEEAAWTYNTILNNIVVGHGYTLDSRQVLDLVAIMSDFSKEERRDFLSFTTGTPRLPIGGFGALSPYLAIVHKAVNNGGNPDDFLPSCSTCQVYLKLPAYSSRDAMKAKLLYAMSDGQGHFALD